MRAVKHIILLIALLTAAGPAFAQYRNLEKALDFYYEKKLDSAKKYIDSAAVHKQTKNDWKTWMVRGFVYKELYKIKEINNPASPLRDISVQSLRISHAIMDTIKDTTGTGTQKPGLRKSLLYLSAQYHNDVIKTLDTLNYQLSIENAEKYVEITKFLDPGFNEKNYFFEVYLTLGSMFEREYEKGESKNCFDRAKVYLFKAYDINKATFSVNKNIGFLYYNQAVSIIKKMDYDIPLDQLPVYQDQSVKLALQALSYCLKAHELDPKDAPVVEALAGIYYLLNENEKHNEYKKLLEELKKGR